MQTKDALYCKLFLSFKIEYLDALNTENFVIVELFYVSVVIRKKNKNLGI